MGLLSGIFGGGQDDVKTTTTTELSPQQQQLLDPVIPIAEQFLANPPQLFPGSEVAGFTPLQQLGQGSALQAAQGPISQQANQASGVQNFLAGDVLFPETNPALQQAIQGAIRPLLQGFEQTVLPGIRSEANQSGQFGGSREGVAQGIGIQALLNQIGDTSAQVQSDAFGQGLDALVRGQALAPQTAGLQLLPGQVIEGVGNQQQGLNQQFLSEAANRFLAEQTIPFNVAQDVAALAFGIPGGTATANNAVPTKSPFSSALGGAALGAQFGGPIGAGIGGLGGLVFGL